MKSFVCEDILRLILFWEDGWQWMSLELEGSVEIWKGKDGLCEEVLGLIRVLVLRILLKWDDLDGMVVVYLEGDVDEVKLFLWYMVSMNFGLK